MTRYLQTIWIVLMLACTTAAWSAPAGTAFTYQGKLTDATGIPMTGSYGMSFKLFDAATAGTQVGSTVTLPEVSVSDGLFTVQLDFGSVWNGQACWLETAVSGTTLTPRAQITSAPSALFSVAPWVTSGSNISYSAGNVGICTQDLAPNLPLTIQGTGANNEWIQLRGPLGANMWHINCRNMGINVAETGAADYRLFIQQGGNVGIGTGAPTTKLDVNGTVRMTGFQLGTSAASGQVLTADASGVGTWQWLWTKRASDLYYAAGMVGVGTTNPQAALHVVGLPTLDQAQEKYSTSTAFSTAWQSFTAERTCGLAAVEIYTGSFSGTCTFTIRQGEGTGGTALFSSTFGVNGSQGWKRFDLGTPVPIVAGQKYTIEVGVQSGQIIIWSAASNPYPGGSLNGSPYDMAFRTFVTGDALLVNGPAKLSNFQLGTSATAGQVLMADASGVGTWRDLPDGPTSLPPTGTAGGDLTGSYPNPTIGTDKIGSTKLASDAASLSKVSGGAMVNASGKVGIGTTNPQALLDVGGIAQVGGLRAYEGGGVSVGTDWTYGSPFQVYAPTYAADQQQTVFAGSTYTTGTQWQSFTAGAIGELVAIQLYVGLYGGGRWTGTFKIFSGEGTGGTLLHSQPIVADGFTYRLFTLTNPVNVTSATKYTVAITPAGGAAIDWKRNPNESYAGGRFSHGATEDAYFITYLATTSSSPALVVQPNTGYVGVGTANPDKPLSIQGAGTAGEWLGLKDTAGTTQWHLNNEDGSLNIVETGAANRMRIAAGGNVGIGTDTPSYKLHVNGSVAGVGAYNQLSDVRYKTNVRRIGSALDKVEALQGITFDWKQSEYPGIGFDDARQAGLIAQEVEKVLPEAVTRDGSGNLSVSYSSLVPLLIEGMKEQQKQIDELKKLVETLTERK